MFYLVKLIAFPPTQDYPRYCLTYFHLYEQQMVDSLDWEHMLLLPIYGFQP